MQDLNLENLLKIQEPERNVAWEKSFLENIVRSNIELLYPDPKNGPDGWPYLLGEVSQSESSEPVFQILSWLSTRGIGLVINPQKEFPDYVLSYGMVWYYCLKGKFFEDQVTLFPSGDLNLKMIAHAGPPTEDYLPLYVRKILREFFMDQSVLEPRIMLLSADRKNYELAFSVESLGALKQSEWKGIAEAISWFVPPHYSILLVNEEDLFPFVSL